MEITLALMPDEAGNKAIQQIVYNVSQIVKQSPYDTAGIITKENIPHLSLFQMDVDDKNLPKVFNKAKDTVRKSSLTKISLSMHNTLSFAEENLFWYPNQQADFMSSFHSVLVDSVKDYRSSSLLQQIPQDISSLSLNQQQLIKTYGVYWGCPGSSFNPHFTIAYNLPESMWNFSDLQLSGLSQNITLNRLTIGQIGFYGNVVKIYNEIEL